LTINKENLAQIVDKLSCFNEAKLLIVTKNQSQKDIFDLLNMGYFSFGENRVQEAVLKYTDVLRNNFKNLKLHLIGPLQSNKTKIALETFDTIQSIDRKKIVDTISDILNNGSIVRVKDFFIQVNIGKEKQKSGIDPEDVIDFYQYCKRKNLNIKGLMCIPPNDLKPEKYFSELKVLREKIDSNLLLSMGMSQDYDIALKFDSNIIRVGSKIFS
tara:strand:+ start:24 stop:665 length:642 start_codon:yes stop_codon:yes gene_type:complete